jgi:hypothetical protein
MLACTAFSSGCLRSAPSRSWCNIAFTSKVRFACYNITNLKMEREGPEKMNNTTSRKACRTGFGSLCIKLRHIISPQKILKSLYRIPPDCIIFFVSETGATCSRMWHQLSCNGYGSHQQPFSDNDQWHPHTYQRSLEVFWVTRITAQQWPGCQAYNQHMHKCFHHINTTCWRNFPAGTWLKQIKQEKNSQYRIVIHEYDKNPWIRSWNLFA